MELTETFAFPPIERYRFVLEFTGPVRLRFFHGGVLMGLLWNALGGREGAPFPAGVIPYACESGRVRYKEGDRYHLLVTFVGEDRRYLPVLERGLRQIGSACWPGNGRPVLWGNFVLTEEPRLMPIAPPRSPASPCAELALRFLSPVNFDRPKSAPSGPPFWDRTYFPVDGFLRHVVTRLAFLARACGAAQACPCSAPPLTGLSGTVCRPEKLFLLDGPQGKKGIASSGVIGRIDVRRLPAEFLPWLDLGQIVHVGNYIHYGLGRYVIWPPSAEEVEAVRPAASLTELATRRSVLDTAARKAIKPRSAPGADGMTPAEALSRKDSLLDEIRSSMRRGDYSPAPYLGLLLPKNSGGYRPVCISTFRDRMAQRAACEVLGPIFESILEDGSFAYRRGRSRMRAAEAVEAAARMGYGYVLKADIESFFDVVPWSHLMEKLAALFPFEPLLDDLREWVTAPVFFEGKLLRRERGLPQGAVISPLLANLVLDEMDEALLGRGFKVVRYADDFVIACRSEEEARRARAETERVLKTLSLALNDEKTRIVSFQDGFTYLGYLFKNSRVVENAREESPPLPGQGPWMGALFGAVPSLAVRPSEGDGGSRAAGGEETPTPADISSEGETLREEQLQGAAGSGVAVAEGKHRLYFCTPGIKLQVRDGRLRWNGGEEADEGALPLREIAHIVISTGVYASTPTLVRVARCGIPVYLVHASGELAACFDPAHANWPLWLAQSSFLSDKQKQLAFCRSVVSAKLHNAADLCVRRKLPEGQGAADAIRRQAESCESADSVGAVRGHEGQGAALFFDAYKRAFSALWNFKARKRHPPPDAVNAMLSFGYATIYHHLATALTVAGLNPRAGIYHHERGAYAALACDLQEEFRHIVDAMVLSLVRRREVTPEDFSPAAPPRRGVLMAAAFRKKFIEALDGRLSRSFTPPGETEQISYRGFMARQASQLKDLVEGRIVSYSPLRRHP